MQSSSYMQGFVENIVIESGIRIYDKYPRTNLHIESGGTYPPWSALMVILDCLPAVSR